MRCGGDDVFRLIRGKRRTCALARAELPAGIVVLRQTLNPQVQYVMTARIPVQ